MLELGKTQTLTIVKINDSGAYLADPEVPEEKVLLPGKQIPMGAHMGTQVEVFLYRDSEDRLIATTKKPAMELGQMAVLEVLQATNIGAFLDWGLEKDLFLPFKEQKVKVRPGQKVLVALYTDKSNRLCATMNVYDRLETGAPYQIGDHVEGTVYGYKEGIGAFIAIDNKYFGLVPEKELYQKVRLGDSVRARVINVRQDGKLNLSMRKKAYSQMKDDAELVMEVIEEFGGVLPFTDKASPEVIKRELQMSKAAFKRAVGQLLKQGRVEITPSAIRKVK